MTQQEVQPKLHPQSLGMRILQSAVLAFVLIILAIALIIVTTDEPVPVGFWLIFPIGVVTFGGACAGVFYYLLDFVRQKGKWQTLVANIFFALCYIPGLYMCLILSLAVTGHWD